MGVMSPLTRAQSGEVLGRVAELRLAHLGELPDFAVVAFAAGKRELHRRHGALFRQQLDLDEATLDGGLDDSRLGHWDLGQSGCNRVGVAGKLRQRARWPLILVE